MKDFPSPLIWWMSYQSETWTWPISSSTPARDHAVDRLFESEIDRKIPCGAGATIFVHKSSDLLIIARE